MHILQLDPLSSQGLDDFPLPLSKGLDRPLKCAIFSPIKAIPWLMAFLEKSLPLWQKIIILLPSRKLHLRWCNFYIFFLVLPDDFYTLHSCPFSQNVKLTSNSLVTLLWASGARVVQWWDKLFTVAYFPKGSLRLSALRYGLPSCMNVKPT